jgi:hypothetical protein
MPETILFERSAMNDFDPDEIFNRPLLILTLRDNPSWRGLCERLKIVDPYDQGKSYVYSLIKEVSALRDLDILEFEGDPWVDQRYDSIRVSDRWKKLQGELGLSLHDLVKISRNGRGLAVTPLFGRPPKMGDHPDIFVIMPFTEDYTRVYTDHVKKVANELELTIGRADDRLDSVDIMKGIWEGIFHAKVVLAEITERNANVFYELGIAHTLGRKFVMIRMKVKGKTAPFDIAGLSWIEYEYTPPGMDDFEKQLAKRVKKALGT